MMNKHLLMIVLLTCPLLPVAAGEIKNDDRPPQVIILRDDQAGDHLTIDLGTGKYRFISCQDPSAPLDGAGEVKITGCEATLQDLGADRLVVASIDLCTGAGKASIKRQVPCLFRDCPMQETTLSDKNIKDSAADCDAVRQ